MKRLKDNIELIPHSIVYDRGVDEQVFNKVLD